VFVLRSSITGHFSLILNINRKKVLGNNNNKNDMNKNYVRINYSHLYLLIQVENWSSIFEDKAVTQSVDFFNDKMNELINLSSNETQCNYKINKKCKLKPWITAGLENIYNKTLKQLFNVNLISYRFQFMNKLIELSKNLYYFNKINKAGMNIKKLWECIKEAFNTKTIKKPM